MATTTRANTATIRFARRGSTLTPSMRAEQQKQLSLRIRDSTVITNSPGLSLVMRGNQRLMSYDADEQKSGHFSEDDVAPADSYDEFVDQLMMKMELLMDLRVPTTGNRFDLKDRKSVV